MTISERRLRTRTALQAAAGVVFARRGVAGASIEEICEEGGFTRGAFYSNFATKDELVLAIIDEEFALAVEGAAGVISDLDDTADASVGQTAPGPDQQREVLQRALEQFKFPFSNSPNRIIAMREIELHSLRHPELRVRLEEVTRMHEERLHTTVGDILNRYGARSRIPLETLVDICHSCYNSAATSAVSANPHADSVDVDRSMLLTVLLAFVEFPEPPSRDHGLQHQ